jgi:hypothetical protein
VSLLRTVFGGTVKVNVAPGPFLPPSDYETEAPNLPGQWKLLRVQRAPYGPFFEYVDIGAAVNPKADCPHCRGAGDLEVESLKTFASRSVNCPWCHGTGKASNCDDASSVVPEATRGVWCDANGNVLDAETDLQEGWITFAWLAAYEPARHAA